MELYQLTIHELLDRLRAGETTSVEITASVFGRIDAVEKDVHAYITLMRETALAEAARADRAIRKGEIGALTGHPDRAEGHLLHERRPDDLRLADPPQFHPALRRHRRGEAPGGRRRLHRQDEHGRIRDGLLHGDLLLRRDPESLGSRTDPRRLQRRLRGGGGRRRVHRRARLRHGRLHPPAGGPLRRRRDEADLRPGLPLRPDRLRLVAGPDRPLHEGCGGLRHPDERDRRLRPEGIDLGAGGGSRLPAVPGPRDRGLEGRDPEGVLHRRDRSGGRGGRPRRRSGSSRRRGRRASRSRFPTPSTVWPSTTSSRRRRPVPTSPATTASSTASAPKRAATCWRCTRRPAPRVSAPR